MYQRSDAPLEPVLPEGVHEFSLHPHGSHSVRGENDDEPIAALQRFADLVVPLLGALDVGVAVPHWNLMVAQNADQPLGELLIYMRMRDENLGRHLGSPPTGLRLGRGAPRRWA